MQWFSLIGPSADGSPKPVKNVTATTAMPILPQSLSMSGGKSHSAQLKDVAHKFEAMFMTEMVKQMRPANQAAGAFAPGKSEETWNVFMDQALGQAAAANGPAGDGSLRQAIEKAVRDADARAHPSPGESK